MRGDCTIRVSGIGFTAGQIAAAVAAKGLLSIELDLSEDIACHCEACALMPRAVLSIEEILGLSDQAIALGARRFILVESPPGGTRGAILEHGKTGDPILSPRLRELIEHLRVRNVEIELFADGDCLNSELAEFMRNRHVAVVLKVDPLLGSSVAIDVLRKAGYCSADAPPLAARVAVRNDNIEALPDWWRRTRSLGVEPYLQMISPRSSADASGRVVAPQRARQLFNELGRIDRDEFGKTWEHPPELTGRSCKRHLFACHVTPCGTIFACVGVTIPLGNIRTESLRTILDESEVLENLRAFGQKVKEPCRTCSKTTDCYGCRGSAYQLTGDYLAGDQLCWKAEGTAIPALPAPIGGMIPHGPRIRMVDRIIAVGERSARTEFVVRSDSLFVDESGRLDEAAYIEMIAQSFAASHGFHLSADEQSLHRGMLLGVKDLRIEGTAHAGDRLFVDVKKVARFGDFGVVEGTVSHEDGRFLASGELKVWRPSVEAEKAMLV